jgi:D-alanine-D-alanine ligase
VIICLPNFLHFPATLAALEAGKHVLCEKPLARNPGECQAMVEAAKRRKVKRPSRLALPLIVKSLTEDGSFGISQSSIVDTDEKLAERVAFVHERIGTAAIAEQYIEGRELYVGVLGNNRLRVLPVWELKFGSLGGQGARQIATQKAKHDLDYQERVGIADGPAKDLAPELYARIQRTAKRIYRILELDGYARIDFRLTADGTPYFIEANPNPEIARSEEFATAAAHDGIEYAELLQRIVMLGISRATLYRKLKRYNIGARATEGHSSQSLQ